MDFLVIDGSNVRSGKNREFQDWVRANSAALAKAAPEGTKLVGIYASMFSTEKHSGFCKVVWRMDSYGAMDRFAAAARENAELGRLLDEMAKFMDVRPGADYSRELLKSVADVSIWGDYPEE